MSFIRKIPLQKRSMRFLYNVPDSELEKRYKIDWMKKYDQDCKKKYEQDKIDWVKKYKQDDWMKGYEQGKYELKTQNQDVFIWCGAVIGMIVFGIIVK
jgi:hypothetical protein